MGRSVTAGKKRFLSRDRRVVFFSRDTHYRDKPLSFSKDASRIILTDGFPLPVGTQLFLPSGRVVPGELSIRTGEEKGIDVRIALDMVRLTYRNAFDVGIIFSQDQDLAEAITEMKEIARDQRRFVHVFCAFPCSDETTNRGPIRGTEAIEIEQAVYDQFLDPSIYQPRR